MLISVINQHCTHLWKLCSYGLYDSVTVLTHCRRVGIPVDRNKVHQFWSQNRLLLKAIVHFRNTANDIVTLFVAKEVCADRSSRFSSALVDITVRTNFHGALFKINECRSLFDFCSVTDTDRPVISFVRESKNFWILKGIGYAGQQIKIRYCKAVFRRVGSYCVVEIFTLRIPTKVR